MLSEAKISHLNQVRLLIAVPGKHWESDFGMCLANMVRDLSQPLADVKNHAFSLYNTKGSILPQVREQLADIAVESKSTHILFLDTDHAFPPQLARVLISRRCDVIAVNCVTKTVPANATARLYDAERPEGVQLRIRAEPTVPVSKVWRVGMGMMLVNVDVFKKLEKPYFTTRWDGRTNHHVGEDWCFCEKLEAAGIPIYVDNQLSPLCTHIGTAHFHWEMQGPETKAQEHAEEMAHVLERTRGIQIIRSLGEVGL